MATPSNPLTAQAGGAPPGGGMLGPILGALSNRAATNPGQDFSQQSAALQGADPGMILRQAEQLQQIMSVMFIRVFQTVPKAANEISGWMKQGTKVIKALQEASTTTEAISSNEQGSSQGPINFSPVAQGAVPGADQGATT